MQLDIYISAQKMPPLMALISFSPLRNATKARNTPWQPTRTCSPLSLRTPLQPMLAGTPALFESAMISPAKSTWRSSVSIFQKSNVPILFVLNRDLVRAGAMGAWAPVKIEQRVSGTRPHKSFQIMKIFIFEKIMKKGQKFWHFNELGTRPVKPLTRSLG